MISVIICSRKPHLAVDLKENIRLTVGTHHEVILFDNSELNEGLCAVYNQCAGKARYQTLCFVHEDVVFRTSDWGKIVLNHLKDPETGIVGIAGGDAFSRVPSTWSNSFISNSIHIIQHYPDREEPSHIRMPADAGVLKRQVIAVDGVFMCVRKPVFNLYKFDDLLLKGFHGYDIDFSLSVSSHFKNYMVYDILLEHFSSGRPEKEWIDSTIRISDKWRKYLPVSVHAMNNLQNGLHHWQTLHVFIENMFKNKYHPLTIYGYAFRYSVSRYLTVRRFLSMNRLLLRNIFQKKSLDKMSSDHTSMEVRMAIQNDI